MMIMKNKDLLIYRIITGLFTIQVAGAAAVYFFNYEMVEQMFIQIKYPSYIIYPLAVVKILGLIAIWTKKSKTLKEWAYAGFVFDFILAISAHLNVKDGEWPGAAIALVLVLASYFYDRKVYGTK